MACTSISCMLGSRGKACEGSAPRCICHRGGPWPLHCWLFANADYQQHHTIGVGRDDASPMPGTSSFFASYCGVFPPTKCVRWVVKAPHLFHSKRVHQTKSCLSRQ